MKYFGKNNKDFVKVLKKVSSILPGLTFATRDDKVALQMSSEEFFKVCSKAAANVFAQTNQNINKLPDTPVVQQLENNFNQIKDLLLALAISKKEMFF